MTNFEAVKSTVTPKMAAEHYGLSVSRNGMVCCPFHDDRHPGMKLNEDYFYSIPIRSAARPGVPTSLQGSSRRRCI